MTSSGIVSGATVFLNPTILGLTFGAYGLQVSDQVVKKQVIEQLKLFEGMVVIQNHHGNFLGILFLYEGEQELKKRLALINSIAGSEVGFFSEMPFPKCDVPLGVMDWRIISLLVKGQFQSYKQLASYLNVSMRTINRKLSKLIDSRAIFTVPILDFRPIKGNVPADLIVFFSSPEARQEAEAKILKLVDHYMFYAGFLKEMGLYNLILPNALTATEIYEQASKVDGVTMVIVELVDERIYQTEILSNYVARRIAVIEQLESNNQRRVA